MQLGLHGGERSKSCPGCLFLGKEPPPPSTPGAPRGWVETGACLDVLENTQKKPLAAAGHRSSDCQGHEKKNALRNDQKTNVVIRSGERISAGSATSQLVAMSAPDYAVKFKHSTPVLSTNS